ncbi:MAG TPA: hypothetical protein VN868_08795 [Terriglobales bacterium]|jgi:hypothetical protein|nr:hypothetical protein [Terriglobales bacterium]
MKESSDPETKGFRLTINYVGTAALLCPVEQSSTGFTHSLAVLVAALREIFDESAYARFLNRRQIASSSEAYAAFCRECEEGKARRPRCC